MLCHSVLHSLSIHSSWADQSTALIRNDLLIILPALVNANKKGKQMFETLHARLNVFSSQALDTTCALSTYMYNIITSLIAFGW